MKKKLKDEVAEAMLELRNGAPLTVSEHEDLISKIKTELEKAHAEVLGSLGSLCKSIVTFSLCLILFPFASDQSNIMNC